MNIEGYVSRQKGTMIAMRKSPLWHFGQWLILQQTMIDLEKIAQEDCGPWNSV